jgi:hypothetical protein
MAEYRHLRTPNLILGDSRAFKIQADTLTMITGEKYYNFATPGGDPGVYIRLFWDINRFVRMDEVYITVSFHNFGDSQRKDLFQQAKTTMTRVYPFFTNPLFVKEAFRVVKLGINQGKVTRWKPPSSGFQIPLGRDPLAQRGPNFETDWKRSASIQENIFGSFHYPDDYVKRLRGVANYCREKNIKLVFIILPNYIDVHKMAVNAHLAGDVERFKQDIRSLAETYDFDYENELTTRKELYTDVWHFSPYVYDVLYREVWRKEPGLAIHTFPGKSN